MVRLVCVVREENFTGSMTAYKINAKTQIHPGLPKDDASPRVEKVSTFYDSNFFLWPHAVFVRQPCDVITDTHQRTSVSVSTCARACGVCVCVCVCVCAHVTRKTKEGNWVKIIQINGVPGQFCDQSETEISHKRSTETLCAHTASVYIDTKLQQTTVISLIKIWYLNNVDVWYLIEAVGKFCLFCILRSSERRYRKVVKNWVSYDFASFSGLTQCCHL